MRSLVELRRPRRLGSTVVVVALASAILYAARLDHTPPHLHRDEAVIALQAMSVANTGRDIDGNRLPLYFHMHLLREGIWFQPMLIYASALTQKLVPPSQTTFRLPAVAVGALDVLLIGVLAARLLGGSWWGASGALLLGMTPAHMLHSRLGMDFIFPLPFVLGWLLCLSIYLERRKPAMLFAATSLLGIGFYSYIASVVMMPTYLVLTWAALLLASERSVAAYLVAAAGFAWPLAAIVMWLPFHPTIVSSTFARYHVGGTMLRTDAGTLRLSGYWKYFDPEFLFVKGGYTRMTNSTRLVGVFALPLAAFVPLGAWAAMTRRRSPLTWIVLLGFLLAPLAATLAMPEEPYASDRELAVVVFGVLLALVGIEYALAHRARWARTAAVVLLALVPLHFAFFLVHYFGDYHRRAAFWFEWNHLGALDEIIARDPDGDRPIYLSSAGEPTMEAFWRLAAAMHGRPELERVPVYFDARTLRVDDIPPRALVLINRDDSTFASLATAGVLRQVSAISEPGDPPYYFVLER